MFSMTTLSAKIEAQVAARKARFYARRPIMRKSIHKHGPDCSAMVKLCHGRGESMPLRRRYRYARP
jgi:hypothetical protein